jgi:hypothetical protein
MRLLTVKGPLPYQNRENYDHEVLDDIGKYL